MNNTVNEYEQKLGFSMESWKGCAFPSKTKIEGAFCLLEKLNPEHHATDLFESFRKDKSNSMWTYLPYGPFLDFMEFDAFLKSQIEQEDPVFYAVIDNKKQKAVGYISFMRIQKEMGVVEIGHVVYSPELQRTATATEAVFLLLNYAFTELGYRRVEWKCDALNEKSRKAALRFGLTFEGIFRQTLVYKNRNRDTAWYSIIDSEWPDLKQAYQSWLYPENFGENGKQVRTLEYYKK